jgi:hypothetical protein
MRRQLLSKEFFCYCKLLLQTANFKYNRMTIKLRYRGRLKDPADVQELIRETEDICLSNGWKSRVWDEDWSKPASLSGEFEDGALHFSGHAPLKGITFSVNESETVWLTFQPDGLLQSLLTLVEPDFTGDSVDFPWQRVKTGFDGAATHLALCKLFRYLSGRYFERFEVMDESGYWQHGDDEKFTEWITDFHRNMAQLEEELAALESDESLDAEESRARYYRLIKEHAEKFRAYPQKPLDKD